MTLPALVRPLAVDCEALRANLVERQLPPVWSLDAETARRLHREGAEALASAWQPPLDTLPVTIEDVAATDGRPAMRIYRHVSRTDKALTVAWLHGGGWVLGDLETGHGAATTACALTGWNVVSIDYRCAPVHSFPSAVDDAIASVRWLLDTGHRVVVAGDSAGGNLAAVVARILSEERGLVGQVLIYPATDPSLSFPSIAEFTEGPFLTQRDMEWFYDAYLRDDSDRTDERVDLVRAPAPGRSVPAVVLTVGHDPLRDEGIAYAAALTERGGPVTWIHAPEQFHGCFTQSGILPSSADRVREVWANAQLMCDRPVDLVT